MTLESDAAILSRGYREGLRHAVEHLRSAATAQRRAATAYLDEGHPGISLRHAHAADVLDDIADDLEGDL